MKKPIHHKRKKKEAKKAPGVRHNKTTPVVFVISSEELENRKELEKKLKSPQKIPRWKYAVTAITIIVLLLILILLANTKITKTGLAFNSGMESKNLPVSSLAAAISIIAATAIITGVFLTKPKIEGFRNDPSALRYLGFEDLKPSQTLETRAGKIPIYDRTSFPEEERSYKLYWPGKDLYLLRADKVDITDNIPDNEKPRTRSVTNELVLLAHGISNGREWVLQYRPSIKVNDILKELERLGYAPRTVFVCNPGEHSVSWGAGKVNYNYPRTSARGSVRYFPDEGMVVEVSGDYQFVGDPYELTRRDIAHARKKPGIGITEVTKGDVARINRRNKPGIGIPEVTKEDIARINRRNKPGIGII